MLEIKNKKIIFKLKAYALLLRWLPKILVLKKKLFSDAKQKNYTKTNVNTHH